MSILKFDCENCAKRAACEDAQPGTFCIAWARELPDPERKDPNPGGWDET